MVVLVGLWEFLGGKVEDGEIDVVVLMCEVCECVGVGVVVGVCIVWCIYEYVGYFVDLVFY